MKKTTYIGGLVLALGLTFGFNSHSLTLGRLSLLSFSGQPLVAEIEIPELSSEESKSLRVRVASAEAFKLAGLAYSAALADLTVTGKRRPDGRPILELRGKQPINAPFIDIVLELTWSSGRMIRDYTVLFDPPARPSQALIVPAPTLPIVAPSISSAPVIDPPVPVVVASPPPPAVAIATPVVEAKLKTKTEDAVKVKAGSKQQVKTKKGDTAAAIAAANKSDEISLDQMLIAMLNNNPQAFINGNVNRLKVGVAIDLPSAEDAADIRAQEAKNSIKAQARDFNDYRRKLAGNVTAVLDKESNQRASGKATAKVQDRQATTKPTDDRLTLAKPVQPGMANAVEEQIAKVKAAADANARADELKKNISDLSKLSGSPQPDLAPAADAPAPAATTPIALPAPSSAPIPRDDAPSLIDQALLHPWALPFAGLVSLALLLSTLFALRRPRRNKDFSEAQDSRISVPISRQSPTDTIFGSMGASEVDTAQERFMSASSSASYPPSKHVATDASDVDPIAEADVYLAYNRDVQAEEILKEAKRHAPQRADIQVKLLEIYAKRQDLKAFEAGAPELHALSSGTGSEWAKALTLASQLGSSHPLFKIDGKGVSTSTTGSSAPLAAASNLNSGAVDFDLSTLILDKPAPATAKVEKKEAAGVAEDPKLALAEEYLSIGDKLGAKILIDEVIRKNSNPHIVALAQQMQKRLG